jgi:CheY-like chemotaxis protein
MPMVHVLVVDDQPAMRKMLCEVLALEGIDTLTAADGQEALEILWKSEEPLITLLDYMMPRMTGLDTLRYLAEDPDRSRRHAFVLMSVWANQHYPRLAAELFPSRALPFLAKPFTVAQLLDALGQANDQLHAGRAT